jgi:phage terminase large subunit GpA-like protein
LIIKGKKRAFRVDVNKKPWFPEKLKRGIATGASLISFKFFPPEKKIYKKQKPMPVDKWAENYRVMTYGPLEGGKWSHNYMPHLAGILNASFFPSVEMIGNCKAPQTGGSVTLETCLAYAADRKPGPALIVYPNKHTAANRNTDYFQPVFKKSPRLRQLMTGRQDDMSGLRIKLMTMLIHMGWAGSATSLGNISVKYLVLDEVDKYQDTPNKKEAGTIDLALKRVIAYKYGRKIWINSTPTTPVGAIWNYLFNEAQVVFDYWVKCPMCGQYLKMVFDDIDFGGERDPVKMATKKLARYACKHCGGMWDDLGRDQAVRDGEWRARDDKKNRDLYTYLRQERPRRICFHSPSWISPLVSLSDPAASFLAWHKTKSRKKLKDFMNQHKAEPWVSYREERGVEDLLKLRDERPRELVPGGGVVQCLLASVDTQDDWFYYEIRAWGWGESLTSWQVREGKIPLDFEELENILFRTTYRDSDGKEYPVQKSVIDAMGHKTTEVYKFCRKHPKKIIPLKGEGRRMAKNYNITTLDVYPNKKKMPGKLYLYRVNTAHFKDLLSDKLEITQGDPGSWMFHSETPRDWVKQMTVEFVNDNDEWECPEGKANHAWDVSVYNLFLAHLYRLDKRVKPTKEKKEGKKSPVTVAKSKFLSGGGEYGR